MYYLFIYADYLFKYTSIEKVPIYPTKKTIAVLYSLYIYYTYLCHKCHGMKNQHSLSLIGATVIIFDFSVI